MSSAVTLDSDNSGESKIMSTNQLIKKISKNERFQFGKNWMGFLSVLNDERVSEAEKSIKNMLGLKDLKGRTFLDVGSGSGLFSLAAVRLGADRVHSFDYDPLSVACAYELKKRYYPNADQWIIEQGSALDVEYLAGLGSWDVVYSWGVLHHTGNMLTALGNVIPLVNNDGKLYIAIYNKQRLLTSFWAWVKRSYSRGNFGIKLILASIFITYSIFRGFIADLILRRNPLRRYLEQYTPRGMSVFYDWIDWIGGYPFEAAKPEEVFEFYKNQGFILEKLVTCYGSSGINEFVFKKTSLQRTGEIKG